MLFGVNSLQNQVSLEQVMKSLLKLLTIPNLRKEKFVILSSPLIHVNIILGRRFK